MTHPHVLPADREDKLRRLREINSQLIPALKQEYETLRDELVPEVEQDGYVYLIGPDGQKYRASVTRTETTFFDTDVLQRELPADVFEELTEPKVIRDKWNQMVSADKIPPALVAKALRFKPKAAFVHFEPGAKT